MARTQKNDKQQERDTEIVERMIAVNRVSKTVKGGRRFGFAALVVVGDQKGRVGFASAKAKEVPEAMKKATEAARRKMIRIPLREGRTIHHDITASYGAGRVTLRSAPSGTGIIAGGAMRAVLEALGVQDVVAKATGTSNPHNVVKATLVALSQTESPRQVAGRRGKKVGEVIANREGTGKAEAHHDEAQEG